MARHVTNGRSGRVIATALLATLFIPIGGSAPSSPAWAQTIGVTQPQAKTAIEDFIKEFVAGQKNQAVVKFPGADYTVRVKIEGLTRVEAKGLGTVWVAQFSGATLPGTYDSKAEQTYSHGILKIYMDKQQGLQVVVNEGEGLWAMQQRTSILYDDLPVDHGGWKTWGGTEDIPEPQNEISEGTAKLGYPPPTTGTASSSSNSEIPKLAAEVKRLGDLVTELKKQGPSKALMDAQLAWEAAHKKYVAAVQAATQNKP